MKSLTIFNKKSYQDITYLLQTGQMHKFVPNLWFNNNAEEAVEFYTTLFRNSKIGERAYYNAASAEVSGMPEGSLLTVVYELEGYQFMALNGGDLFSPTPAISFTVSMPDDEEIDRLWKALADGGEVLMELGSYPFSEKYGWVSDRFGISWQLIRSDEEVEQKIVPSFLYTREVFGKAEEAINLYTSLFENSKIDALNRYNDGMMDPETAEKYGDAVAHSVFSLEGEKFIAMDGGGEHDFTFTEAISIVIYVNTQEEIDRLWSALSAFPDSEQCSWLKDKYGVSWQVVPRVLDEMLSDQDKEKADRVMEAMLQMKKLDISELEWAYRG